MTGQAGAIANGSLAGLRILVVEDEMLVAMYLEDLLADLGCEVVGPVSQVAEGVALAEEQAIHGAILDVNISGVKVYPVADVLAARNIPFIFLTGYGAAGLRAVDRDRPVLQKPFRRQDLERLMVVGQWGRR